MKTMKILTSLKILTSFIVIYTMTVVAAMASEYNYVSPEKVKTWLETKTPITIVDIQVEEEFEAHHLPGSLATYSYPVKSDSEKAQIDDAVAASIKTGNPVVVVCPRGGGGAKRCYDYMKSQNIHDDRLLILKGGIDGWPYKEMLETSK
jgi:rhodanese-related sulfurtransferase